MSKHGWPQNCQPEVTADRKSDIWLSLLQAVKLSWLAKLANWLVLFFYAQSKLPLALDLTIQRDNSQQDLAGRIIVYKNKGRQKR